MDLWFWNIKSFLWKIYDLYRIFKSLARTLWMKSPQISEIQCVVTQAIDLDPSVTQWMRSVTMSKDLCAVWQVLKCYSVTGSLCSVTVFKCYSAQCHYVKRSLCNVTVLKCYNMQQQWYRECQMITVGLIDPSQCHRLTVHSAQCTEHNVSIISQCTESQ